MEHDDNESYQNESGIFLSLKRRRKAKLSSRGCNSDPGTFKYLSILPDVGVDDTEASPSRPSLDAIVYNVPTQPVEHIEILPCSDNAQEAIDTFDSRTPGPSINTRALLPEETTYKLEAFDKHALVILNQKDGKKPRHGTEIDVDSLTKTFKNFCFEVKSHDNLTKDALFEVIKEFSERDFTDYGCVAVAILTHGGVNGMLKAKDELYSEIDVIQYFKRYSNPTLVSKPKVFIIQACRGPKLRAGVPVFQAGQIRRDGDAKEPEPYYFLPFESDLLILHSSYPGCASHRDEIYGSWFIQTLCNRINALSPNQDLESIITEVKRAVAIDMEYEDYNPGTLMWQVNKQMPVMTSTLIRKLYLIPPSGALEETYMDRCRQTFSMPMSPGPAQFGQCVCFLEHFTYMTNCLSHFVEENPNDETAKVILDAANAYEDNIRFYDCKEKMCKLISKHLMDKTQDHPFHKYLHFVPTDGKSPKSPNIQNELSMIQNPSILTDSKQEEVPNSTILLFLFFCVYVVQLLRLWWTDFGNYFFNG